jgi:hypothetical protein
MLAGKPASFLRTRQPAVRPMPPPTQYCPVRPVNATPRRNKV